MRKKSLELLVGVVSLTLGLSPAYAATSSSNFQVSANFTSSCSITGSAMNFGSGIDPVSAVVPLNSTASLSVACSNTTPYVVALDAGTHAGGGTNFSGRKIQNGTSTIGYQLYTDTGRTMVWGNGIGSSVSAGLGTGTTQSLAVYGQVADLTGAVPGTYTDLVTVTITY